MRFKTEKRGYDLSLEQDLLGDFVLIRYWYGLTNRRHGMKTQIFNDVNEANDKFNTLVNMRLHKGYRVISKS